MHSVWYLTLPPTYREAVPSKDYEVDGYEHLSTDGNLCRSYVSPTEQWWSTVFICNPRLQRTLEIASLTDLLELCCEDTVFTVLFFYFMSFIAEILGYSDFLILSVLPPILLNDFLCQAEILALRLSICLYQQSSWHADFSQLYSGVSQAVGLSGKDSQSLLELSPWLFDSEKLIWGFDTWGWYCILWKSSQGQSLPRADLPGSPESCVVMAVDWEFRCLSCV